MQFRAEFWHTIAITALPVLLPFQCLVAQKCLVCVLTARPHPGYLQHQRIITSCLSACPLMRPPRDMVSSTGPSEGSCRTLLLTLLHRKDWMCAPTPVSHLLLNYLSIPWYSFLRQGCLFSSIANNKHLLEIQICIQNLV